MCIRDRCWDELDAEADEVMFAALDPDMDAVSYTHLDVYKRQRVHSPGEDARAADTRGDWAAGADVYKRQGRERG